MQTKKENLEKDYRDISSLYDMAEELASTVESDFTKNPESQLQLVEPLIGQLADCADLLSEEFVTVLEKPVLAKTAKGRVESALRKIFTALDAYRKQLMAQAEPLLQGLVNIADPIVEKIRKQAEKIILIFMQLMDISLERIMHKAEMEDFKRSNDKAMASFSIAGH